MWNSIQTTMGEEQYQTLDTNQLIKLFVKLVAFCNYSFTRFNLPKNVVNYGCSNLGISKYI